MSRSPVRVVIVMLDDQRRIAIGGTLQRAGFDVVYIQDQKAAVSRFVKDPPDVFLLDRHTPDGGDVLERLAAIRLELTLKGAFILLVSSRPPSLEDQKLAHAIGPVSFLSDSSDEREVFTALRQALSTNQQTEPFTATSSVQVLADEDWKARNGATRRGSSLEPDDRLETVPPFPGYQEKLVGREKVLNKLRHLIESDSRRVPERPPTDHGRDVVNVEGLDRVSGPSLRSEERERPQAPPPRDEPVTADDEESASQWTWGDYEAEEEDSDESRERISSETDDLGCSEDEAREIIAGFFDEED